MTPSLKILHQDDAMAVAHVGATQVGVFIKALRCDHLPIMDAGLCTLAQANPEGGAMLSLIIPHTPISDPATMKCMTTTLAVHRDYLKHIAVVIEPGETASLLLKSALRTLAVVTR